MEFFPLEVKDLSIRYGSKPVLDQISFSLDSHGFYAILGKNGSGKSSLIKALVGEMPFEGNIFYGESSVRDLSTRDLSSIASYLPQKLELGINMTVRELVLFGRIRFRKPFSGPSSDDEGMVETALEKFGISHLSENMITNVSGGERQMAWLAQLYAQDTPLIFLDEPTLNLDLANRAFVFSSLQKMVVEEGRTVILVTHEIEYLNEINGSGLLIKDGEIGFSDLNPAFLSSAKAYMESFSRIQ